MGYNNGVPARWDRFLTYFALKVEASANQEVGRPPRGWTQNDLVRGVLPLFAAGLVATAAIGVIVVVVLMLVGGIGS